MSGLWRNIIRLGYHWFSPLYFVNISNIARFFQSQLDDGIMLAREMVILGRQHSNWFYFWWTLNFLLKYILKLWFSCWKLYFDNSQKNITDFQSAHYYLSISVNEVQKLLSAVSRDRDGPDRILLKEEEGQEKDLVLLKILHEDEDIIHSFTGKNCSFLTM